MKDRGVLYVAFGEPARAQAKASIRSLHKHLPGLAVLVVSDLPMDGCNVLMRADEDQGARAYKTRMYELSPFRHTLFLDADTELVASPEAGFKLLDYVDVVLAQDVNRVLEYNRWRHLLPEEVNATRAELGTGHHMYFNSGVIFFTRNERVEAMMKAWAEEWERWRVQDQLALVRAIHRCPVRIAPMRHPWNTHHRGEAQMVYHKHRAARRAGAPQ